MKVAATVQVSHLCMKKPGRLSCLLRKRWVSVFPEQE